MKLYITVPGNDNLAVIFEAELKAAIDNQEPQKWAIFKRCFQP